MKLFCKRPFVKQKIFTTTHFLFVNQKKFDPQNLTKLIMCSPFYLFFHRVLNSFFIFFLPASPPIPLPCRGWRWWGDSKSFIFFSNVFLGDVHHLQLFQRGSKFANFGRWKKKKNSNSCKELPSCEIFPKLQIQNYFFLFDYIYHF